MSARRRLFARSFYALLAHRPLAGLSPSCPPVLTGVLHVRPHKCHVRKGGLMALSSPGRRPRASCVRVQGWAALPLEPGHRSSAGRSCVSFVSPSFVNRGLVRWPPAVPGQVPAVQTSSGPWILPPRPRCSMSSARSQRGSSCRAALASSCPLPTCPRCSSPTAGVRSRGFAGSGPGHDGAGPAVLGRRGGVVRELQLRWGSRFCGAHSRHLGPLCSGASSREFAERQVRWSSTYCRASALHFSSAELPRAALRRRGWSGPLRFDAPSWWYRIASSGGPQLTVQIR